MQLSFYPTERVAVFIDGCFWHGCPRHYTAPATNTGFWTEKLDRNRWRDREADRALRVDGWRVVRLWEHEVRDSLDLAANRVISALAEVAWLSSARAD